MDTRPLAATDPFAVPVSAASPLARRIAARIRQDGPLTFAAFMEAALYDPEHGYYRSGRPTVGRDGDYLTSPEVHPVFGYSVAMVAQATWQALGRPAPFTFRDVGPGTGALAEQVATWAQAQAPDFAAALRLELVEASARARERQAARLAGIDGVRWTAALAEATPATGMVFANELLDAQPVHRLRGSASGWDELFVGLGAKGGFVDVIGPPSDPALLAPLDGLTPAPGQVVEVCPGLAPLLTALAGGLQRGLLCLFDYGYPRADLYAAWRRGGTLMTFARQTPGDDPYQRVGTQDLTCHVDFDTVRSAAGAAGLQPFAVRAQGEFLTAIGAGAAPAEGGISDDYLARRRAVQILSDPAGLGRIRVLAFGRGIDADLPGLGRPGEESHG